MPVAWSPLASLSRQELALTAAQSVFGVAVLGNLEVTTLEATAVFGLFTTEFVAAAVVPTGARPGIRLGFAVIYVVAGGVVLFVKRRDTVALLRDGFGTPYAELGGPR